MADRRRWHPNPNIHDDTKKFIGGAERARRDARKRQRCPPGADRGGGNSRRRGDADTGQYRSEARLPKSMRPFDRFFASLLTSSVIDFEESNVDDTARGNLMQDVCNRAGLPLPSKLQASSRDAYHFYSTRASLVMEESRFILADALRKGKPSNPHGRARNNGPTLLRMRLVSKEEKEKIGATVLVFEKLAQSTKQKGADSAPFTPQELYDMRPGCCFEINTRGKVAAEEADDFIPLNGGGTDASVLATVVPKTSNADGKSELALMMFRRISLLPTCDEGVWEVRPLTTLISEARQFEACTRAPKVSFLPKLLGWKDASHIRFPDSADDEEEEKKSEVDLGLAEESNDDVVKDVLLPTAFCLPKLNLTQERAASEFLSSPPSTLTLVQGPPGTGKTTFLVSVICRCLTESAVPRAKRILVTAPTNKAIAVLADRFLNALSSLSTFNVIMIGVEDKLVTDHDASKDTFAVSSTLRDVFVYTWVESIIDDFQSMSLLLRTKEHFRLKANDIIAKACHLKSKLERGIPRLYKESGASDYVDQYLSCLENSRPSPTEDEDHIDDSSQLISLSSQLVANLESINRAAATQELLATANVIFSTLATAGVSVMKQTRRVDDLFIDEAAAATEPEVCIPFHLAPERMLAVGDPMQLPSTVMSHQAINLGLNKSMHERLMFDCAREHIMLDVQYRMKPDISLFPSRMFYHGKLSNGENVVRKEYGCHAAIISGDPFTFLNVIGSEQQQSYCGSFSNLEEAKVVVQLVKRIRDAHARKESTGGPMPWYSTDKVRIITFYQGQVSLIRRLLQQNGLGQVLVATVDSSQGCEADTVILSFVRSNNKRGSIRHKTGFLCDDRRMNVALTRARFQLIGIGNATGTLATAGGDTLKAFIADAANRRCVSSFESLR